jgi:hypothetical protein
MAPQQRTSAIRLAVKALANGGRYKISPDGKPMPHSIEWDVSGDCLSPKVREFDGRVSKRDQKYVLPLQDGRSIFVTLTVRCRKCEKCLSARAARWRYRVKHEHSKAVRSWFSTLTLRPDVHEHIANQCRLHFIRNGLDFDMLPEKDQWKELVKAHGRLTTLFYKRVRKAGARIRYCQVAEKHKSGLLHWHVIIHEPSPDHPALHAVLKKAWEWGFSDFKLADNSHEVTYICKYLTKSVLAKVRASTDYGKDLL